MGNFGHTVKRAARAAKRAAKSVRRAPQAAEKPRTKIEPDIVVTADRSKIRQDLNTQLSDKEIEALGINLPAGHNHYRAYVGPPFLYDIIGALQFGFLLDLGLREQHSVLEIGCGSLRVGRLLINWLLPDRYFGLEPNRKILEQGIKNHFGAPMNTSDIIRLKKPRFAYNEDFDFSFTAGPVDFIFAQSIASHTGVKETELLMKAISDVSHQTSITMMTYIRTENVDNCNTEDGWFYPKCVTYTDQFVADIASKLRLHAYVTSWPVSNKADDGFISGQTPLILTKTPWRPSFAQKLSGQALGSEIRQLC